MAKICTLNKPYPCEDVAGSKCTVCGHAGRNHIYFKEIGMGDFCICTVCKGTDKEEKFYADTCDYISKVKFMKAAEKLKGE